jgi:hypothetical protein
MSSQIFKLSSITLAVAASFGAHAALYNVYEYQVSGAEETHGVAISPLVDSGQTNCFSDSCIQTTSNIAYEGKKYQEGFQYRDEVPFFMAFGFDYLEHGYDGFRDYCGAYLGYTSTLCDEWAKDNYTNGYAKEVGGDSYNSTAYVENTQIQASEKNVIINSLDATDGEAVGNIQADDYSESGYKRNQAYYQSATALSNGDRSFAWANLTEGSPAVEYVAGSISTKQSNNVDYSSKATIWENNAVNTISWDGADENNGRVMPQGSARDIAKVTSASVTAEILAVGYNSDSDERLRAAVFHKSSGSWTQKSFVSGFDSGDRSLDNYLNSTLSSVNNSGMAIGTYKLRNVINNGAYTNGLFYVDDVAASSPEQKSFTGEIFFEGANGKAGAINNNSEVVGAIDYQQHREVDGKPRAQRAFIAPLGGTNKSNIFSDRAWYLDDLTNDGNATSQNNNFRIIDATDINDVGIISASALMCTDSSGSAKAYDTVAIDSLCDGGRVGAEKIVAVKLVPINGNDKSNIQSRPVTEEDKVDRQGGSLGFLALTLLGFLGFRRK